jgi:hypothetical protein
LISFGLANRTREVADDIADEEKRRGDQQGILIEEAWALYKKWQWQK